MDASCTNAYAPLPTPEDIGPTRRFVELSRVVELGRVGRGGRALVFLRERDGRIVVAVVNVDADGKIRRIGSVLRVERDDLNEIAAAAKQARRTV